MPGADFYSARYYGAGAGKSFSGSGYGAFDAQTSNSRTLARCIARHFSPCRLLDVGTATGLFVAAIRGEGFEAMGCDGSGSAIGLAAPEISKFLFELDLSSDVPPLADNFDIVTAFEVLEHVAPQSVPHALARLRSFSPKFIIATMPSFGPNTGGADGWLEGKVAWDRIDDYRARGPEYDGPVRFEDLAFDADGYPIEGHVTIASFRWWTRQFEAVGFVRDTPRELALGESFRAAGKQGLWNLYVFVPAAGR